jgi:mono/diheme cytochrome c family protein
MTKWAWLLFFAGAAMAADQGAPPWERSSPPPGQSLFRENCAVCHDIDKDQKSTRKLGPSLNHLFKNPKLPLSKSKPTRAYVTVRIQYGGSVMPAFMKRMNEAQIATLLAYLESK